ncbi:hypothetical protein FD825_12675 [Klebsiella pneumoniae]|nr:hypothetical protein [Klebsiella pneumoniae]HBX4910115.1 hypothetical protein [Klebsiella pneumoniae]
MSSLQMVGQLQQHPNNPRLLRLSNLKQRNNQQLIQNLRQLMVVNLSRLAISQLLLLNHRFQKNMN